MLCVPVWCTYLFRLLSVDGDRPNSITVFEDLAGYDLVAAVARPFRGAGNGAFIPLNEDEAPLML